MTAQLEISRQEAPRLTVPVHAAAADAVAFLVLGASAGQARTISPRP